MAPRRKPYSKTSERLATARKINRGRPEIPAKLTVGESTWLRQVEGAVGLLYRLAHTQAIHGVPWVRNMLRYYLGGAAALLDSPPHRLQAVADHYAGVATRSARLAECPKAT